MRDVFARLYRTKMILSSLVLVAAGIILFVVGNAVQSWHGWGWLRALPWHELGGILIGGGLLSIWLDHFLRREQQDLDDLRLRQLLAEQAPVMRDAVLQAFAANHEDLKRVANPQLLDQIITNSLALRLEDAQFAEEIYHDIRDQAVAASERWHDASLSIEISPLKDVGQAKTTSIRFFNVTVRWEYTTTPKHAQRRFVCLSDRDEYTEIMNERGATSAWYLKPTGGVDAGSKDAFELLRFSVDGDERPIRRTARQKGQVYTASVGNDIVKASRPVTIAYTYRTVTTQHGHLLFFDIEQPTRDLRVDFDYSDCDIASVSTLDLIPSIRPTRIERTPESLPAHVIRVHLEGWIFPRSGIAFVWILNSEKRPITVRANSSA